jgi:cytoskeletal protein RodZ
VITLDFDYSPVDLRGKGIRNGVFDTSNYPNRPASAQGRFSNAVSGAPPGFGGAEAIRTGELDPAMAQALATLSAAGNLTPAQIQQIEMQLRFNSQDASSLWAEKPRAAHNDNSKREKNFGSNRSAISPNRGRDNRTLSPTSESSPTNRSALLEEFRNNKSKKYELRVIIILM